MERPPGVLGGRLVSMSKAKTAKKQMQRIPRVKDEEGNYLDIEGRNYVWRIGWVIPELGGEFGYILANKVSQKTDDLTNAAIQAVCDYCKRKGIELPHKGEEFQFDSVTHAKGALRAANAALYYHQKNKPLPEWAKIAFANGFQAPKGWVP